eukprot:6196537-Pleurochrysis_carterae.AAC.1
MLSLLKCNIRKIFKKATREHAKKTNSDIGQVDDLLNILHASQFRKPSAKGTAMRNRLIEEKMQLKKTLSTPKPQSSYFISSYFIFRESELISRQFGNLHSLQRPKPSKAH